MRDPSGKVRWSVKMTEEEKLAATPFPCGKCLHCKINNRRVWTHRLLLEQRCHTYSCFVTLTYSDEFLPPGGNLDPAALTNYLKRLRYHCEKEFRYFAVGEYGTQSDRPHYHLALFGLGEHHSNAIERSWYKGKIPIGHVHVGDLTQQSAAYIVGYVIKKLTRPDDPRLGTLLVPEFMRSSRQNGGMGYPAILKIAKKINADPRLAGQYIKELHYGKKSLPLGRYLTVKLAELTNIPQETIKKEFGEYQAQFFDTVTPYYYDFIVDQNKVRRESQRIKFEMFNNQRKRTL